MAENHFRHRENRRVTETCTTSECISDFGETPPRRFAADHQENADSTCSITRCVASLRGHTKRFAFLYDRGWRGVPAAPPRPPLICRLLISCVLAHALSPRLKVLHG